MKNYFIAVIGILLMDFFVSCSVTNLINVSKKEIKELKIVHSGYKIGKLPIDRKWIFYEQNICQYTIRIFYKERTYTGTWCDINDTIKAFFFLKSKYIAKENTFIIDRQRGRLIQFKQDTLKEEYTFK